MKKISIIALLVSVVSFAFGNEITLSMEASEDNGKATINVFLASDGTHTIGSSDIFINVANSTNFGLFVIASQGVFSNDADAGSYDATRLVSQDNGLLHLIVSKNVFGSGNGNGVSGKHLVVSLEADIKEVCSSVNASFVKKGAISTFDSHPIKSGIDISAKLYEVLFDTLETPIIHKEGEDLKLQNEYDNVEWYNNGLLVAEDVQSLKYESGVYLVKVDNECVTKLSKPFDQGVITSVKDSLSTSNIANVFPNPIKDDFSVQVQSKTLGAFRVLKANVDGTDQSTIYEGNISQSVQKFDLSTVALGISKGPKIFTIEFPNGELVSIKVVVID